MTHFNKLLTLVLFLFLGTKLNAQVTLYSDNFESTSGWSNFGFTSPNNWVISNCTSFSGTKAAYISSGGISNDCSPTGIEHYGYTNASALFQEVVIAREITATCFSSMSFEAQVKIQGEAANDQLEFVYSIDNGATWVVLGAPIFNQATFSLASRNLPAILDGTVFYVGFRFRVNNSVVGLAAPAIDDFVFKGISSDLTLPLISCPLPAPQPTDSVCNFNLIDYRSLAITSDNCGGFSIAQSPVVGTPSSTNTLIVLTVTDWSGNSTFCSFTQTLIDTLKPVATCTPSISVFADVSCKGIVPDIVALATAVDNCSPSDSMTFFQVPASGTFITVATNISVYVIDESGNVNSCFTHVGIIDTVAPTITCPPTQTVSSNSGCNHTLNDFTGLAIMADDCSTLFTLSQIPAIGSTVAADTHLITLIGQDQSGNAANCVFTAIILENTPPLVVCPSNLIVPANALCEGALENYISLITVTDNCTSSNLIPLTQNPILGFSFSDSTVVTISGTDLNGNVGSCLFTVFAIDQVGPTVLCLADSVVPMLAPCQITIPNLVGTHSASDNCTSSGMLTFSQSPLAGTVVGNPTNVVITYQDANGNSGTCITFVKPNDLVLPTITCPPTQTFDAGIMCSTILPNFVPLTSASDNCSNFAISQSPQAGLPIGTGQNNITMTVTDVAGNLATCAFTFLVTEFVSPTLLCPLSSVHCNPLVDYASPNGQDNCLFQLNQTDNSGFTDGDVFPIGITNQSYEIIDSTGNSATCAFTITVLDYPDTANIQTDTIYLCDVYSTTLSSDATQSGSATWNVLTPGVNVSSSTANTTTVSNLQIGLNKIEWKVNSVSCGSNSDTAYIYVNTPPPTASIPDTITACAATGFLLQGSSVGNGSGEWSSASGVTFANPTIILTSIISVPGIYSDVIWTISAGACAGSSDTAFLISPNPAKILTNDTSLCFEDLPFTVLADGLSANQTAYWFDKNGKIEFNNSTGNSTEIINSLGGTSYVYFRVTDQICGVSKDSIQIQINFCSNISEQLPTLFTPNQDGQNDEFYFANIIQQFGPIEIVIINRYGGIVFEGGPNVEYWDGTFKNEPVPMGTYFYKISSLSNAFETVEGAISIVR